MDKAIDGKAFRAAIGALALSFGKEATIATYDAYWLGLSDLPLPAVEHAVAQAIRTCEHFPRPVDLRRLAGEKTTEQRAIAAWSDVQGALSIGSYKPVDFEDKVINATIRNMSGGWPAFLERFTGSEETKWARADFIKAYASLSNAGVNGEACAALPGLSQKTAIGGEVVDPRPVRIGCDVDRARLAAPARRTAIKNNAAGPRLELKNARSL